MGSRRVAGAQRTAGARRAMGARRRTSANRAARAQRTEGDNFEKDVYMEFCERLCDGADRFCTMLSHSAEIVDRGTDGTT